MAGLVGITLLNSGVHLREHFPKTEIVCALRQSNSTRPSTRKGVHVSSLASVSSRAPTVRVLDGFSVDHYRIPAGCQGRAVIISWQLTVTSVDSKSGQ
jgi:hypothetical protein